MSVTVHEILRLKTFNKFRLIAGANGLDRRVIKGGFIDHETPELIIRDFIKHELIFSTLPMIQGEPELIVGYLDALNQADCSGFAIKTVFFDHIPEEAINYANENNFPLFLFDETYIEELILDIDETVNVHKKMGKKLQLVDELMHSNSDVYTVKNTAMALNPYFEQNIQVFSVKIISEQHIRLDLSLAGEVLGNKSIIIPIKDRILIFVSDNSVLHLNLKQILYALGLKGDTCLVGYSQMFTSLGELDIALHQAEIALDYACLTEKSEVLYDSIGIYKLLIPIMDHKITSKYYETIIESLKNYDTVHNSDLLTTAIVYVEQDGDIKETASLLFQHVNTVRYRIRKIKEILNFEELKGMKYETLSIAIHLYKLNMKRYRLSKK